MTESRKAVMGLGTWGLTSEYWGRSAESVKILHSAFREGILHYDTAPVYGKGRSEQLLGQQLKRFPGLREKVEVATKCFTKPLDQVKKSFETSLKRLCTDYVDIFYIHWPSNRFDFAPVLSYLEEEKKRGRVRHIGVSNFALKELQRALNYASVEYCQEGYNLLWLVPEEEIFPFCRENKIKTVSYSALAQGLISRKYPEKPIFEQGDYRQKLFYFKEEVWPQVLQIQSCLDSIAERLGISMAQLSLAFLLSSPVDLVLFGASTKQQFLEDIKAKDLLLSSKDLKEIRLLGESIKGFYPESGNFFEHSQEW